MRSARQLYLMALATCQAFVIGSVMGQGMNQSGGEFSITGGKPGDQMNPSVALSSSGGYVVWQDNHSDGFGLGISARQIDSSGAVGMNSFRVNETVADDQENPKIQALSGGGFLVVWQSGSLGFQDIFGRIIGSDGTFQTSEFRINSHAAGDQRDPSLAVLGNGNAVIVWSSWGQESSPGSMMGIYGQLIDANGAMVNSEFQVNQYSLYNQRQASVASLGDSDFVVVWIAERFRGFDFGPFDATITPDGTEGVPLFHVEVNGRVFSENDGSEEFLISSLDAVASGPSISSGEDGGYLVTWTSSDGDGAAHDISARTFDSNGGKSEIVRLNEYRVGDQYGVKSASVTGGYLSVWNTIGQEGDLEEVYGRLVSNAGDPNGNPFRVNGISTHKQLHPDVTSSNSEAVVTWSSFSLETTNFEIKAQRYSAGAQLTPPASPFVSAVNSRSLQVSWADLSGQGVVNYLVRIDGNDQIVETSVNSIVLSDLHPVETVSVAYAYQLEGGGTSPFSESVTGSTWGYDDNFDGLPDDWQSKHWGDVPGDWSRPSDDSDLDGASNFQEFLAGTDPRDVDDVLSLWIQVTDQGPRLNWNTIPGNTYQIQYSNDLSSWADLEGPRFAAGENDSLFAVTSTTFAYYRIVRLR